MTTTQRIRRFGLLAALTVGIVLATLPSGAQSEQYDTHVIFRSHVPHVGSGHGGGAGGSSKPGSGGGGGTVSFSGAGYTNFGSTQTLTSTGPEAEEHIATDPTDTQHLVAAISDFSLRGGSNTTKFAYTSDGGVNWSESYVPLDSNDNLLTADGHSWPYNSDPVVAIDRAGRVYLADLYFNSGGGNDSNGLYVSVGNVSTAGLGIGTSTTHPVAANYDNSPTNDEDKEWIAVDNSGGANDGNVYVSWSRFVGNSDMIVFSRSTDHGLTWSAPFQISPASQNGAVQGSAVAVGPNGDVYVAYEVFFVGGSRRQYIAKSTNGGASFSTPAAATPSFSELSFNSTYRKSSFPALTVSPSGAVYMIYAAQTGTGSSILFTRSTDGGSSFSAPLALNDSATGQRLMPAIATDADGQIHASWFDTRNASRNSAATYDIFATRSVNGGGAFSPNRRVTLSSISAGSASFIGDYSGIAANSTSANPVWTNGGFNGGKLQTQSLIK